MNPVLYRLVSGMPQIVDGNDDGAPLVSFHNMRPEIAMRLAHRILHGLELCDREDEALAGSDDSKVRELGE